MSNAFSNFLRKVWASSAHLQIEAEQSRLLSQLRLFQDFTFFAGQQCHTTNIQDGRIAEEPAFHVFLEEAYPGSFPDGVRFLFRLYNAPEGVRIAVRDNIGQGQRKTPILQLVVGSDANGMGGDIVKPKGELREIRTAGGFGITLYQLVSRDTSQQLKIDVPFFAGWEADLANDRPAVGSMQVSATLAPLTTRAIPPPGTFWDMGGDPQTVLTIVRCTTRLLFPFVSNQVGFDTGISISNTSQDYSAGTIPTDGACTIYYHGRTEGGGPAPPDQKSTVIAAGEQLTFTLSRGNAAQGIAGASGFQGYIIAECEFGRARGYVMITRQGPVFGGAQGYLAEVLPEQTE